MNRVFAAAAAAALSLSVTSASLAGGAKARRMEDKRSVVVTEDRMPGSEMRRNESMMGTVTAVNKDANTFTLREEGGKEHTLKVDRSALDRLAVGDKVSVRIEYKEMTR